MPLTIDFSPGIAFADFNAVDAQGHLAVSRSQFRGFALKQGRMIELRDHEGNSCDAVVEAVRGRVIITRPYLWTWNDAPQHQIAVQRDVYPARLVRFSEEEAGAEVPA